MPIEPIILKPVSVIQQMGIPSSIVETARERLLEFLKKNHPEIHPDQIDLIAFKLVVWNDTSLGYPEEGESYAQVETPGYQLEFRVGNHCFDVHIDATGTNTAIPNHR